MSDNTLLEKAEAFIVECRNTIGILGRESETILDHFAEELKALEDQNTKLSDECDRLRAELDEARNVIR